MQNDNAPRVGVFDSGIGGLTVLAECARQAPQAIYYYYGDNAHAPYGARGPREIAGFVGAAVRRLRLYGVCAVVLACNTATAVCVDMLRKTCPVPIVGIEPAVAPAARRCRRVLVLTTPVTARSERLRRLTEGFPQCDITVYGAPGLAAVIERGLSRGEGVTIFDHLPSGRYDGVVLGCTHYAFFRREIGLFYGCPVFDGARGTAARLRQLLSDMGPGTDDHLLFTRNTNKCFSKKAKYHHKKQVIFLGKCKKINEYVYNANICFI